jgi:DNA polymerase I
MPYGGNARIELHGLSKVLEQRLIPITAEMNSHPLRVNKETWLTNTAAAAESAHCLIEYCRQLSGDNLFRPHSPKDCGRVLFTEKGITPTKVSKKSGVPSTEKSILTELANAGNTLAEAIIVARSAITQYSQLKAWGKYADAGQVQCVWNSMGQPHGRYSSESPNLTNRIPPIRETIEPPPNYSFLSLDLNQAELVSWASLSGDSAFSKLFRNGADIHLATAIAVRKAVPTWDLRGQPERDAGKLLNFCILYQMQPHTLARKLGCSTETASRIIHAYYARVPRAAAYIKKVLKDAKNNGFVETNFGRRRYCPEYQNPANDREEHEIAKTLWSHVNSGTAAEYLKRKQVEVWEAIRQARLTSNEARLSLNVFDECIFTVKDSLLPEVRGIIEPIWLKHESGFLPFKATIQTGKTWRQCST